MRVWLSCESGLAKGRAGASPRGAAELPGRSLLAVQGRELHWVGRRDWPALDVAGQAPLSGGQSQNSLLLEVNGGGSWTAWVDPKQRSTWPSNALPCLEPPAGLSARGRALLPVEQQRSKSPIAPTHGSEAAPSPPTLVFTWSGRGSWFSWAQGRLPRASAERSDGPPRLWATETFLEGARVVSPIWDP